MKKILSIVGHQEWLHFGVRDRIIRMFHTSGSSGDVPFERPFFGRRYKGNLNTFIDWSVYYYGAYTKEELLCMRDFLEVMDHPVVVDVGANIGHHSLFASTIAARVHSFEPFPAVIRKLEEKLELNAVKNVTVHKAGLGDTTETLSFFPPNTSNTGTGSFCNSEGKGEAIELEVRRADDYFESAGITRIDYLKMDIEGFEVKALQGMRETLTKHRPVCFVEWTQGKQGGALRSGAALFPEKYQFFKLAVNEPFLVFFRKKDYRLVPVGEAWPDANLVAVPREYIDRVRAMNPPPRIAARLEK
ncbi:MAG: hypothetical protein JWM59_2560 [Verrucomicrobiales bacterium]|nr:hypothetical protein [Verrucomicrobiales bacterium]